MTVTGVSNFSNFAHLAQAAYALATSQEDLKDKLIATADFTVTEAADFCERYQFISAQPNQSDGFSATLFKDKSAGKYILAMRGTEMDKGPANALADVTADLFIGTAGYAKNQAASMYRYWRELTTPAGVQVAYSYAEMFNLFCIDYGISDPSHLTPALALNLVGFLASLQSDVGVSADQPAGQPVLSPDAVVDVAGHSLGGHLAMLFARFFPKNTGEVVTLNAPGFFPGSALLTALGYPPPADAKITRLEGDGDAISELGAISMWPGKKIALAQENYPGAAASVSSDHSSVNGADSLALMQVIAQISPAWENKIDDLSALLRGASAKPELTYETLLDGLRKIILGPDVTLTPTSKGTDPTSREPYYANLKELREAIFKGGNSYQLVSLIGKSAADISVLASEPDGLYYRYALQNLNPFAVLGANYSQYDTAGQLDPFDVSSGSGSLTPSWIQARSAMLSWKMLLNTKDISTSESNPYNPGLGTSAAYYEDLASGTRIYLGQPEGGQHNRRYFVFGADGKTLAGDNLADSLFAGDGSETLKGGAGDDYLEAGCGVDVLNGGLGNDTYQLGRLKGMVNATDTIEDSDGLGSIWLGDTQLTGGTATGATFTWKSADGTQYQFATTRAGGLFFNGEIGTLTISQGALGGNNDQIVINNFDLSRAQSKDGYLGIKLGSKKIALVAGVDPQSNPFSVGNFNPANVQASLSATGTQVVTAFVSAVSDTDQTITLTVSGSATGEFSIKTEASLIPAVNGQVRLTIPAGANSVSFALVGEGGTSSAGNLSLTANFDNPSGADATAPAASNMLTEGVAATSPANATIVGGAHDSYIEDWWVTTDGVSTRNTPATSNQLRGGGGNDLIVASQAGDVVRGGAGNDWILQWGGGMQPLDVTGGSGDNLISSNGGGGTLRGGGGTNLIDARNCRGLEALFDMLPDGRSAPDYAHLNLAQIWNIVAGHFQVVDRWAAPGDFAPTCEVLGGGYVIDLPPMALKFGDAYLDAQPSFGTENFNGTLNSYTYTFDPKTWRLDVVTPNGKHTVYNLVETISPVANSQPVTLIGGQGKNVLYANDAGDLLLGGNDNDVIVGGSGNDTILAGNGADTVVGGDGDDFIQAAEGPRASGKAYLIGGAGNNTIRGGSATSFLFAGDDSTDWATSQQGDNIVEGGSGDTVIYGAGGNDTLSAGSGKTTIYGGAGNELLQGGSGLSFLVAGKGTDTLIAGSGDATLQGGVGQNFLYGGTGTDVIYGGTGTTVIYAGDGGSAQAPTQVFVGSGATTVVGGAGVAKIVAGSGTDVLYAGDGTATVWGGIGRDTLWGGAGNSTLIGGLGATTFMAGAGRQTIVGGNGGNTLMINADAGQVEVANVGTRTTVRFGSGVTVDDLALSAAFGANDAPAIAIDTGRSGTVLLDIGGGLVDAFNFADGTSFTLKQLMAYIGTTQLTANGPNGSFTFSMADGDSVVGGTGNDTLVGLGWGASLVSGTGASTLVGGASRQNFYVNNAADVVFAGRGSVGNTVFASVNYVLPDDVQNLSLTGSADLIGTGNSLSNVIKANGGNDTLVAGSGIATLVGGAGNDTFVVNNEADVVISSPQAGHDIVRSSVSYTLPEHVSTLILTGNANLAAWSNADGGMLVANDGNDTLVGGIGDDTLVSGGGNDSLDGGAGTNTYVFNAGFGQDTIAATPGMDILEFGPGIQAGDLAVTATLDAYGNPVLRIADAAGDTILAADGLAGRIAQVRFADGATLGFADFLAQARTTPARLIQPRGELIFGFAVGEAISGGSGDDTLTGWGRNDTLTAGTGNDQILAGGDASVLIGGVGSDVLTGWGDGDTFVAGAGDNVLAGHGNGNTYVLTAGGLTRIEDGATTGTETLWLPQGMRLADFAAVRDGDDLILQSLVGGTTAVVTGFFLDRPSGVNWVLASDQELPQDLGKWVAQQNVAATDYASTIDLAKRTFDATLQAGLAKLGRAGRTLGWGDDYSYLALGWSFGKYTFDGVTTLAVVVDGDPLVLPSSQTDHQSVVTQKQTVQISEPVYSTVVSPGRVYDVSLPQQASGFAYPGGATVSRLPNGSFRVFEPDLVRTVLSGQVTTTRTWDCQITLADRGFTIQHVTGGSGDTVITTSGPFVGTVTLGDGNNQVNLGTTSATRWDIFLNSNNFPVNATNPIGLGAFVHAGNGCDTIIGTDGDDVLVAGTGYDVLDGGRGSDTYYVPLSGDSATVITDSGDPTSDGTAQTALYGGELPMDTLVLPVGVTPSDLKWRVFENPESAGQHILQLQYGHANVLIAYADPYSLPWWVSGAVNAASVGIERFQFADGTVLTREQLTAVAIPMADDFDPVATASHRTVATGETLSASQLVSATDTGDNVVTRYEFVSAGSDGGYFKWKGVPQQSGATIDIGAADLANLVYVGGSSAGSDEIQVRVFDGATWSEWSAGFVSTVDGPLIAASAASQRVIGTPGAPNVLIGEYGNDTLVGGGVRDTFLYNVGNGVVHIMDNGGDNTLLFGPDISPDQISLGIGSSLLLRVNDSGDLIHVDGFDPTHAQDFSTIRTFRFDDGTVLTYDQLVARGFDIIGGDGDEILTGTNLDNRIYAGSGNDVLIGSGAHDTLDGGAGIDTMIGGAGIETFVVDNVADVVQADAKGVNTIQTLVSFTAADHVQTLQGIGDADLILVGNGQNDYVIANDGQDTLVAGVGADTLVGGGGVDTFVVSLGSGQTTIVDQPKAANGQSSDDTLVFGAGVVATDLRFMLVGTDLEIGYGSGGDRVTLQDFAPNGVAGPHTIDRLTFADGNTATYTVDDQNVLHMTLVDSQGQWRGNVWECLGGKRNSDAFNADSINWARAWSNSKSDWDTYNYDSGGTRLSDAWSYSDGTRGSKTYFADGRVYAQVTYAHDDGSTYSTDTVSAPDGSYQQSWANSDGTASSVMVDAAGVVKGDSWIQADGVQGVDAGGHGLRLGGTGADTLTAGDGVALFAGGVGNDLIQLGRGHDLVAFDVGDGQDTVVAGDGTANALSLGGAINYADLAFCKTGNDLVLDIGVNDAITFKDWYAGKQSFVKLQVMTEAMAGYSPSSPDPLLAAKVETFDFRQLVAAFDQAQAATPEPNAWQLSNDLLNAHLAGSDTAALGGDLAYGYGTQGHWTGWGVGAAQSTLSFSDFAVAPQTIAPTSNLSGEVARLR